MAWPDRWKPRFEKSRPTWWPVTRRRWWPCYEVADGRYGPWIALDIDVSVFDNSHTKKQGVSWTYKKVDGFAPIFAYLGQEGYLINCQLRQGSQHSQEGAPDFLRDTLRLARRITGEKLLVRMDSAHDDLATVRQLRRTPKTDFIVKRNLRRESKQTWLENAQALGTCTCPRAGKEVFTGSLRSDRVSSNGWFTRSCGARSAPRVRRC